MCVCVLHKNSIVLYLTHFPPTPWLEQPFRELKYMLAAAPALCWEDLQPSASLLYKTQDVGS